MRRSTIRSRSFLRAVAFSVATFVGLTALPIALKWMLVGRWKEDVIPIWGLRYFRFWLVKTLVQSSPMALFVGNPIFNVYLRLLGAKIGRNVVINAKLVPACTDLLSIGDNTIVRKDATLLGYKAQSNYIHTGPISIGANAFVGEATVLDINTVMEDDTQLGHASSLHDGQRVPRGKHYHGSPAQETSAELLHRRGEGVHAAAALAPIDALQLFWAFAVSMPATIMLLNYALPYLFLQIAGEAPLGAEASASLWRTLVYDMLLGSAALYFGGVLVGLAVVLTVPRLFNLVLKENRTYVLYGLHYYVYRVIASVSNPSRSTTSCSATAPPSSITCDGSATSLNKIEQTGSNFGTDQKHDNPFLCDIGSGTMVSDGLSMINVDDVEHVVHAPHSEDRRPQLPWQQHQLPGRRQGRRELSPGHQGHDPDRRPGARERRAPGFALFRDSARGRAGQAIQSRFRRSGPPGAAAPQESPQPRDGRRGPAAQLGDIRHDPAGHMSLAARLPAATA